MIVIFGMHFDSTDLYTIVGAVGLLTLDWVLGIVQVIRTDGIKAISSNLLPKQFETLIRVWLSGLSLASVIQAATGGASGSAIGTAFAAFVIAAGATLAQRCLNDIRLKIAVIFGPAPAKAAAA